MLENNFVGVGSRLASALALVGVTEDRVAGWLGKPCGCKERQAKLDQLGYWAERVLKGKTTNAKAYLLGIIGLSLRTANPSEKEQSYGKHAG